MRCLWRNIERAKDNPKIPFTVFKPTGLISFALLEKVTAGKKLTDEEEENEPNVRNNLLKYRMVREYNKKIQSYKGSSSKITNDIPTEYPDKFNEEEIIKRTKTLIKKLNKYTMY